MRFIPLFILLFSFTSPVFANTDNNYGENDNSKIEGAKLCTQYFPKQERQYDIPVHLLAAIASTESGRYHRELGINMPWPWTVKSNGKKFFFENKDAAIAAAKRFQDGGSKDLYVGCMQINTNVFTNLDQAFDPSYNTSYAAQLLKNKFIEKKSWRAAVTYYHSDTTENHDQYTNIVFDAWSKIINKLADARAGKSALPNNNAQNMIPNASDGKPYINTDKYYAPDNTGMASFHYENTNIGVADAIGKNEILRKENSNLSQSIQGFINEANQIDNLSSMLQLEKSEDILSNNPNIIAKMIEYGIISSPEIFVKLKPEELHRILGRAKGYIDYNLDMAKGWEAIGGTGNRLAGGYTMPLSDYVQKFSNAHDINDYKANAEKNMPAFAGMTENATITKTINGVTYTKVNGQWYK